MRGQPLRDSAGQIVRWFGTATDIEEQMQAQARLLDSQRQLSETFALLDTLLSSAPIGIAHVDRDYRFIRVNRALAEMNGGTLETHLGRTVQEVVPELWEQLEPIYRQVLDSGQPVVNLDITGETAAAPGVTRSWLASYYPVRHEADIIGIGLLVMDITERKHLEDQFRQSQKMEALGRLAGGIAHDLNNVLTVILGHGEYTREALDDDSPAAQAIDRMIEASLRGSSLTGQLLAFSRGQVSQPEVLPFNETVREFIRLFERIIPEDIVTEIRVPDTPLYVHADRIQIGQILLNMTLNARDAMPRGGNITISIQEVTLDESFVANHSGARPGAFVEMAIRDTGSGMDAETAARVYEPFFTTKEQGKGTGLGLSTVHGIVAQSGGFITLDSAVEQGTTFTVYLPVVPAPMATEKAPATKAERPRGSETILLVEDEEEVLKIVERMLAICGYKVLTASSRAEALALIHSASVPISLLMSDVVLTDSSGLLLAEELVQMRPAMKLLFISGYSDKTLDERGILKSGKALLSKPFTLNALAHKVREVLDAGDA